MREVQVVAPKVPLTDIDEKKKFYGYSGTNGQKYTFRRIPDEGWIIIRLDNPYYGYIQPSLPDTLKEAMIMVTDEYPDVCILEFVNKTEFYSWIVS